MKVAILAPTPTSLYSRLVTYLVAQEQAIDLALIVIRSIWSFNRFRGEVQRDGSRLIRKILYKLILREGGTSRDGESSLVALARSIHLPGKNLKHLGHQYGVPIHSVQDLNDHRSETVLRRADLDLIVFTGGGLVRPNILEIPELGVLNCHTGLLPRFRGMDIVEWAVLESGTSTPQLGLSLHFMEKGVDTGPILLREKLPPHPNETIEAVKNRLERRMVELMLAGIRGLRDGRLTQEAQELSSGRQYYVMHPRLKRAAQSRMPKIADPL